MNLEYLLDDVSIFGDPEYVFYIGYIKGTMIPELKKMDSNIYKKIVDILLDASKKYNYETPDTTARLVDFLKSFSAVDFLNAAFMNPNLREDIYKWLILCKRLGKDPHEIQIIVDGYAHINPLIFLWGKN